MGRPKGSKNVFSTRINHICKTCGTQFTTAAHRTNAGFCCHEHYATSLINTKHSEIIKSKISNSLKGKYIGKKSHKWINGKSVRRGYVLIHSPNHPFKNNRNYVLEHRLVMENHIGRYLKPEEIVHHINEIRNDNRISNLLLLANQSEHQKLHRYLRKHI